jgi:hypothetical protein
MDRDERIATRAYAIWERDGRPEGRSEEHWHRALQEIEDEDRAVGALGKVRRKAKAAIESVAQGAIQMAAAAASAGVTAAAEVVEEAIKPRRPRVRKAAVPATAPGAEPVSKPRRGRAGKESWSPADITQAVAKTAGSKPAASQPPASQPAASQPTKATKRRKRADAVAH